MPSNKKVRIQDRSITSRPEIPNRKKVTIARHSGTKSSVTKPQKSISSALEPRSLSKKEQSRAKGKAPATHQDQEDSSLLNNWVPPSTFTIIAGSYEKLLYGLQGTFPSSSTSTSKDDDDLVPTLKPIFIFPAHIGCVKAVAASPHGGKWLATGSADEIVKVWDLRRRKEIGGLMQHQGSITHLSFPSRSHLLSASEDGTLALFRARDWTLLRTFKGHKDRVNCAAVHPSGKLALSVGKDRTIRMWDFMRGKGSASVKIGKEGELIRWSPSGSIFAVQSRSDIDIYSTKMALLCQIHHPSRIQDVQFFSRPDSTLELLLVAAEDKKVSVYEADSAEEEEAHYRIIAEFVGHSNRVKALATLPVTLPNGSTTSYMSTVSSDGKILLYNLAHLPPPTITPPSPLPIIQPIASYDTKGTRLTCVAMADAEVASSIVNGQKRKRGSNDESDVSEEEASEDGEENEDENPESEDE
ncbi:hypothetical protein FRC03_007526 [Tulasnella sp. 419]|nr:hypothetical protein FRC03_007526 [Tulasnella sp. 419]